MISYLHKKLLKRIYKAFILKVSVLSKENLARYEKSPSFATIDVKTDKGVFTFVFKEDLRARKKRRLDSNYIAYYMIELVIPGNIVDINEVLTTRIVLVTVNTMFITPRINILTELLSDVYLDRIISFIKLRRSGVC